MKPFALATASLLAGTLTLSAAVPAFVITVKTNNAGSSASTQFTIPTNADATYSYDVDCYSDGTPDVSGATGDYTCNYAMEGTYTVRITGTFPQIYFNNTGDRKKILSVEMWGDNPWSSMQNAFYGCENLVINAADAPDLGAVTSMSRMFSGASALGLGSGSWNWTTTNVTAMDYLFYYATPFNKNIGSWDVSNVTTMKSMFDGAAVFNQNIGSWDVSNVADMYGMFRYAAQFNQNIGGWNVAGVENMSYMFSYATAFNQNIGNWDVSHVGNMAYMFGNATAFNQDIGSWDVSGVSNMYATFYKASAFNQDIGRWNVSQVTTMGEMFSGASVFNQDIGNWNVSNVTEVNSMFSTASAFNQDLGAWDFSKIYNYSAMFLGTTLSVGHYDSLLAGLDATATSQGAAFHAGNAYYCQGADNRQNLMSEQGWIFIDSGVNCAYYINTPSQANVASGTSEALVVSRSTTEPQYTTSYTIVGGADAAQFTLNPLSGQLSFETPPDASNPTDSDGDNVYRVSVLATDETNRDIKTFRITVGGSNRPNITPLIMYLLN